MTRRKLTFWQADQLRSDRGLVTGPSLAFPRKVYRLGFRLLNFRLCCVHLRQSGLYSSSTEEYCTLSYLKVSQLEKAYFWQCTQLLV